MSGSTAVRVPPIEKKERPVRKGLERCVMCGRVIRPSVRKTPHPETAECKAQQIVNAYAARGWSQVANVTQGELVEQAGAPIEWALGGLHQEHIPAVRDERGRTASAGTWVFVQHNVGFVPEGVSRVLVLLSRVQLEPSYRRRVIRALWDAPDMLAALDSVRRLGQGSPFRAALREAVEDAELRRDAAQKKLEEHDGEPDQTNGHAGVASS